MSNGLPQVTLEGTLVGDPELRFTPKGIAVAKFRVACNERRFDKETNAWKEAGTTFLTGSCWRTLAENVCESLRQGDRIVAVGTLSQRGWETKEGEKRTSYEFDVESVGPSLRFASAKIIRAERSSKPDEQRPPADDPWATAPTGDATTDPPF
jgi:single-strand DNA-binding protein